MGSKSSVAIVGSDNIGLGTPVMFPETLVDLTIEYGWGGLEVDDETWHVLTHEKNSAWGHTYQRPPRPPKPVAG